jgi:hypothetical protein
MTHAVPKWLQCQVVDRRSKRVMGTEELSFLAKQHISFLYPGPGWDLECARPLLGMLRCDCVIEGMYVGK